jgi:hypothetical protein
LAAWDSKVFQGYRGRLKENSEKGETLILKKCVGLLGFLAFANPFLSPERVQTPAQDVQPTAKEILEKYQTAIGGGSAWRALTTRSTKSFYQTEDGSKELL